MNNKLTYTRKMSAVLHTEDFINAGLTQQEMIDCIVKSFSEEIVRIEKYPVNSNIEIHLFRANTLIGDLVQDINYEFDKLLSGKKS